MDRPRLRSTASWALPFALALVVALELARPFTAGPVAFDAAAAVLHFDRIMSGRHLEAFLSTTPKPLLTLVYGTLHALVPDWRVVSWAAILAFAAGVAVAANLARRLGGPLAWAFAAVALAGAPLLLFDAGLALGMPWALLLWALAGWFATAIRPRWGLAGVALFAASLVRVETLVIVVIALAVVAVLSFGPRRWRRQVDRGAWLLAIGFLAVPIAMAHDLLLTGDPFFWLTVAARYSEATHQRVLSPVGLLDLMSHHYAAIGGLLLLAVIGWLRTVRMGSWAIAIGLFALGPGIAAFLVLLAARHTYVPERYLAPVDVAVAFAAALSIPALRIDIGRWAVPASLDRHAATAGLAVAAVAAVLLTGTWGPMATDVRRTVRTQLWMARNEVLVLPTLRSAVASARTSSPAPPVPLLYVPTQLVPQVVVDLHARLPEVASTDPSKVSPATGYPGVGQLLFYDRRGQDNAVVFAPITVTEPTRTGSVIVYPLTFDRARGYWVVRIDAAR